MSINDFHASLCNEDNSDLDSLRCLREAQVELMGPLLDDGWIPWGV